MGLRPVTVLADAGYCNEEDLAGLEALGVDGHVALGRGGPARGRGGRGGGIRPRRPWPGSWRTEAGRGAIRATQVALGGADRLDQGRRSASADSACGGWTRSRASGTSSAWR